MRKPAEMHSASRRHGNNIYPTTEFQFVYGMQWHSPYRWFSMLKFNAAISHYVSDLKQANCPHQL